MSDDDDFPAPEVRKSNCGLFFRILILILVDIICVAVVYGYDCLVEEYFIPFNSGFFCGDLTLEYPQKGSTVSSTLLIYSTTLLPVVTVAAIEGINALYQRRVDVLGARISAMVVNIYRHILVFFFSACSNYVVVHAMKFFAGRLRPYFIEACIPSFNCTENPGRFVEYSEYTCLGNLDYYGAFKLRTSFPSSHASMVFFAAVYLGFYVEKKIEWDGSFLLKRLFQVLWITYSAFTSLTRLSDNKNHYEDILTGSLVGIVGGMFSAIYIGRVLEYAPGAGAFGRGRRFTEWGDDLSPSV